ncbi:hypothetical protein GLW07_19065 [Bacillus hwajinpoensis]|uniref:Uncharacterized protein n=1 Tax=Guptibacillus hwajinpoensis TaxID=208199 RepID=A0A845F3C4_9BACL|nr:hypothetical protein [Pseudalkalibacillus hwajinpoensis]MYL65463.1 hypothetical protein [Pseudalkalibacillus hwajinpoensis]
MKKTISSVFAASLIVGSLSSPALANSFENDVNNAKTIEVEAIDTDNIHFPDGMNPIVKREYKAALLKGNVKAVKGVGTDGVEQPGDGSSYTVVDVESNQFLYDNYDDIKPIAWGAVGALFPGGYTYEARVVIGGAVGFATNKLSSDPGPNYYETKLVKWYSDYYGQYVYQTSHTVYSDGSGSTVTDVYVSGTLDKVRANNGYGWEYTAI